MKKQYVYIGQFYHIKNKELPLDYKFGVTDNLTQREYSLGRTKSPIKYMILKAWEIPVSVPRERVEDLIEAIFAEHKYDGCEWYDIDGDIFQNKISIIFQIISKMVVDGDFNFIEVNLNEEGGENIVEVEIEKEIRSGKKSPWTNLRIEIDGVDISGDSARKGFVNAFEKVVEKISPVQIALDFNKIFKPNNDDYPEYKRSQSQKIDNFFLDTQSSTKEKSKILKDLFDKYGIEGNIEIF